MWKKEDAKPEGVPGNSATPVNSATLSSFATASTPSISSALPSSSRAAACISQGIRIKGEVTGSEDKVQLWSTGQVTGEVQTDRLAIEDGALLRGKVEAGRQPQPSKTPEIKASAATASATASATTTGKAADAASLNSGTAAAN